MLFTILIIIFILMLIGSLPTWGYSSGWGWSPVGIIVFLLVLWLIFGNRLVM